MPPLPSDAAPRPPGDFAGVLATAEPLLLVGGQAVNLWALSYHDRTSDLAPFVSRDADVLGGRETLKALGRLTGTKPQFFPLRPPSNEIGVVIAKDAAGASLLVAVLRQVPGPIALFRAKVANLADLKQTGRQDGRHVLILARVLPAYLEDLRVSAREGRMTERQFVEFLEQLLKVVISRHGRKACAALKLDPSQFFAELVADGLPKLKPFLGQRLPRALASIEDRGFA